MWIYGFLLSFLCYHPLHVSICDVVYQDDLHSLQITHRIFAEDLAKGMESTGVGSSNEIWVDSASVNQHIQRYLDRHFGIIIGEKEIKLHYLGSEIEDDVFWCYLEATGIKSFESVEVYNTVLTEVFADQENIVHVKVEEAVKSMRLNKGRVRDRVSF